MQALPPPADCTVQGMSIEALEPEYNFRRPYTLGYTDFVEDLTHVLPYLRPFQDPTLRTRYKKFLRLLDKTMVLRRLKNHVLPQLRLSLDLIMRTRYLHASGDGSDLK